MARILLADDDEALRDFAKRTLASEGHAVTDVANGGDALAELQAASDSIDLLITDIDMPVMDGVTLAQKVRDAVPSMRILLMSGFDSELDRASSLPAEQAGLLSKPFTLEQFRAAVKEMLG